MIDDIVKYLEDNSIGTVGTDIFIGELPYDKNNIIAIMTSPSPNPNRSIPFFNEAFDIWARFSDYDTGFNKLQDIFDLIHGGESYDLENKHVYLSWSIGMIKYNGRDLERRHLFQLSLAFIYRGASEQS